MLMAYAKAGTNMHVANLLGKAPEKAKDHAMTVLGPSRIPNSSTVKSLICGSGKGSMDVTAGWTLVCNTLLKVYSECTESAGVEEPTGGIELKEAMRAFIDDAKNNI